MSNLIKRKSADRPTDPVCGMTVNRGPSSLQASYQNRTYFFCTPDCKQSFEADPLKYLALTPKKKGIWGRYVDRLNKATGGKTPSCCG
jgi:Cu+-exporting ATPase